MIERNRKVDIESLTEEQFEEVQKTIREKVQKRLKLASDDINKYLKIYGLEAALAVEIRKEGETNLINETNPTEEIGDTNG